MASAIVTKETLKRIISDISDIIKNPLHDNGIYYEHDESHMLKGYVMIIPTDDTPYQYGYYFFSVEFPTNYPYAPPIVTYLTNNGKTRFHPNLYRNGKVCLSILNTWKGEQWTSCNTLSSILLNIVMLFTNKPFLHEPGIYETHHAFQAYTDTIIYQNYKTAICKVVMDEEYLDKLVHMKKYFGDTIITQYKKNKEAISQKLGTLVEQHKEGFHLEVPLYKMYEYIDYPKLYLKLKEYNSKLV